MANRYNTVLYIGVTNDLTRRIGEHKSGEMSGFTSRYNINKLVYYETFSSIEAAIFREKQLKNCSRNKKVNLILAKNPGWVDLPLR